MLNDDTKQNDSYFIFSFLQKIWLEYMSEMRCNLNKIKICLNLSMSVDPFKQT